MPLLSFAERLSRRRPDGYGKLGLTLEWTSLESHRGPCLTWKRGYLVVLMVM